MAYDVNNIKLPIIPFNIINNSESDVYIYTQGKVLKGGSETSYYLSNFDGTCTQFKPNQPLQSYGLALQKGKTVSAKLPQLEAIRIYVSLKNNLKITTNENSIPKAPSADVPDEDNWNYYTIWDFAEGTWHDYGSFSILHLNVTQVDAFGLAFKIEHRGYNPAKPTEPLTIKNGFNSDTARANIFKDLKKAGEPWSKLIINDAQGTPVRALMPLKSIGRNVFPKDQLDKHLDDIKELYGPKASPKAKMIFLRDGVEYQGNWADEGKWPSNFIFYANKSEDANGKPTAHFRMPTPSTKLCYTNDLDKTMIAFNSKNEDIPNPSKAINDTREALCAALTATLLRTTLIKNPNFPVPQKQRGDYYQNDPICQYAKIIHNYGINNHAFCYGYDEIAQDAGENRDARNPTSCTLTIMGAKRESIMDDKSLYISNFLTGDILPDVGPPGGNRVNVRVGPKSFAQVTTEAGVPGTHPISAAPPSVARPWTVHLGGHAPAVVTHLPAIASVGPPLTAAAYQPTA